jgi:hypothetical protein
MALLARDSYSFQHKSRNPSIKRPRRPIQGFYGARFGGRSRHCGANNILNISEAYQKQKDNTLYNMLIYSERRPALVKTSASAMKIFRAHIGFLDAAKGSIVALEHFYRLEGPCLCTKQTPLIQM